MARRKVPPLTQQAKSHYIEGTLGGRDKEKREARDA